MMNWFLVGWRVAEPRILFAGEDKKAVLDYFVTNYLNFVNNYEEFQLCSGAGKLTLQPQVEGSLSGTARKPRSDKGTPRKQKLTPAPVATRPILQVEEEDDSNTKCYICGGIAVAFIGQYAVCQTHRGGN